MEIQPRLAERAILTGYFTGGPRPRPRDGISPDFGSPFPRIAKDGNDRLTSERRRRIPFFNSRANVKARARARGLASLQINFPRVCHTIHVDVKKNVSSALRCNVCDIFNIEIPFAACIDYRMCSARSNAQRISLAFNRIQTFETYVNQALFDGKYKTPLSSDHVRSLVQLNIARRMYLF